MPGKPNRIMLINVTHAEESRVVILTDAVLDSFEIETVDQKSRKGDIHTGRVESVQPALQAAFVDIGDERSAFLPLDEVNFNIYPSRKEGARGRIENHLHRGQTVLVQIVRDAFANKPPTLSTYYSLPGRHLVLTPGHDSSGVSRKLPDKERDKIKKILTDLKPPEPHGLIVRTAAAGATKLDLKRDLKYLLRLWERIEQAAQKAGPGRLVYKERSMVIRAMRDLYSPEIDEVLVDDKVTYEEILDFMSLAAPTKVKTVRLHQGQRPIFNRFNVEEQLENIFRRRVPLESGGAVIFDSTEALTAVDVNSGKMKKEGHIEDTATKANIEAAREIARQLRLRDLGGLIVIDFIDMRQQKNVRAVEKAMKDAMKGDKARFDVTRISRLGLMEISRERVGAQKASLRYRDCPVCAGTGSIKTVEAAAMQALRKLQTRIVRGDLQHIEISVPKEVAEYLSNNKREELLAWEQRYGTRVTVVGDSALGRDDAEVRAVQRERSAEERALVAPPSEEEIYAEADAEAEAEAEAAAHEDEHEDADESGGGEEGAPKKRRRRRRRRRRSRGGEGEAEAGESADRAGNGESAEPDQRDDAGEPAEPAEPAEIAASDDAGDHEDGERPRKRRRRRRRRGGRRRNGETAPGAAEGHEAAASGAPESGRPEPAPLAATIAALPDASSGELPRFGWWRRLLGTDDSSE